MQRRTSKTRAFDPDPDAPNQSCDHPDCDQPAGYRAPRGRDNLRSYYWFCLQHVRQYNANWDYYRGMTPGQIENHLRADTSWQRPSWKLGAMTGSARSSFTVDDLQDPLDILNARRTHPTQESPPRQQAPEALRQPLALLDLGWPTTLEDVKTRYRALARRYHPDANKDDPRAEERFKTIASAYATLRSHFTSAENVATAE
ncbi:J domain-containing protein [Saccharibacter floricola]|nr:J domain-containing protein [Saccharibacter floricola]